MIFVINLALAQEPASTETSFSRHELAVMSVVEEDRRAAEALWQAALLERVAAADVREHDQLVELVEMCPMGLTGAAFSRCVIAFASAEAIRAGQPITVGFRGGNVAATVPQSWPYGASYNPYPAVTSDYYQNIAYGAGPGLATAGYYPTAEILRRLTLEVSDLRVETINNSAAIVQIASH